MIDEDEAALQRAILAQPNEPMNFRVYADWLEEHGRDKEAALLRAAVTMRVDWREPEERIYTAFARVTDRRGWRYRLWPLDSSLRDILRRSISSEPVLLVLPSEGTDPVFGVRLDGSSPDNDQWWGWLLVIATLDGESLEEARARLDAEIRELFPESEPV